jgi:hypothetical protein
MEYVLNKLFTCMVLMCIGFAATPSQAAEVSGKIGYMSGVLAAQQPDGTVRVMAPQSEVLEGDMLETAKNTYAQVLMNDGTRMTLRPNTNLKIESYHFKQDEPQADNAIFRLLKGGLRTLSGLISKRGNADAYQLRAKTTTLGIRGTDFSTRLCATKNCADDGELTKAGKPIAQAKIVGRVVGLQGEIGANAAGEAVHKLILDSPVYEGDILQSGSKSYAIVIFRDGGRITLQADSQFKIEQYKYGKDVEQESAILRLLKGGARVITGLIGRINHDNYSFRVAAATLGIRGTGFDVWCNGPCAEGADDFGATSGKPREGAGVFVWSGKVALTGLAGTLAVEADQAAYIERGTGKPVPLPDVPAYIKANAVPKPDSIPVDVDKLFEESDGEPGIYLLVHDGQVVMTQDTEKIVIGHGDNGYANGQVMKRLSTTPNFMENDNYPGNIDMNGNGTNPGSNQNTCVGGQ